MNSRPALNWLRLAHVVVLLLIAAAVAIAAPTTSTTSAPSNDAVDCRTLELAVDSITNPADKGAACLSAARCILVSQCAPMLARELAGDSGARADLASAASRALALVTQAEGLIGAEPREDQTECVELLRAFGQIFEAIGNGSSDEQAKGRLITACNNLALYLDDSREGLVASVKLWQGAAYRRAGRPDRSLQVLRPAISQPASAAIGFLASVERCRALADRGNFPAAIALVLRLSERAEGWLDSNGEEPRRQSIRILDGLRISLLRDWSSELRKQGQTQQAADLEKDADALARKLNIGSAAAEPFPLVEAVAELPECHATAESQPAESEATPE